MGETLRQLKIKTGVVRRLKKELGMYAKELEGEKSRVQQMKDAGADPFDVKQAVRRCGPGRRGPLTLTGLRRCLPPLSQEQVMAESAMMVPDCKQRLETALGDLHGLVVRRRAPPPLPPGTDAAAARRGRRRRRRAWRRARSSRRRRRPSRRPRRNSSEKRRGGALPSRRRPTKRGRAPLGAREGREGDVRRR